jgi:ABC-type multidrug transport system fused ATPase/permease subunit
MPDPDRTSLNRTPENRHFIARHLKEARGVLVFTSLILLVQAILIAALPWPTLFLIDRLLVPTLMGQPPKALPFDLGLAPDVLVATAPVLVAGALVVLAFVIGLLDVKQDSLIGTASQKVVEGVRTDLLKLLLTRRQSYIDSRRRIDLIGRISSDATTLEILIATALSTLLKGLPLLLLVLGLTLTVEPRFTIVVASALPLMYGLVRFFNRHARDELKNVRGETAYLEQDADHTVGALATIKSLSLEPLALDRLLDRSHRISEHTVQARRAQGQMTASLHLVKNLLRALAVLIGGTAVARGDLTLGGLTLLLAYIETISKPVTDLAQLAVIHSRATASIERIDDLYAELKTQEETQGSLNISSLPFPDATALHFENVSFAFEDGPFLLENFSADFQGGELIAVIGPSGGGKSTLGRLMNRLLDPIEGRILLGRTDIRRFRLQLLRRNITLFRHEPFIIEGTVRENLLLGLPEDQAPPEESEISEALHLVNASDFVAALPERLDTVIGGAQGAQLAFDQIKRLHLARAFLRPESRVFVFDQPTANLDPESATLVFEAVRKLTDRGALVFWITHRLEDVADCDRVVFLNSRKPLVGTHDELLNNEPTYRAYLSRSRRSTPAQPPQMNV